MKSRFNFSYLLETLEKYPTENRYQYIVESISVLPALLKDYGDRGHGMRLLLKTLPSYEQRLALAELMRHLILNVDDCSDVLAALHITQHEGFRQKQRQFWSQLPCHHLQQALNESESSSSSERKTRSITNKKRELSHSGMFSKQREQDEIVVKKVKEVIVRHSYNLRERKKK